MGWIGGGARQTHVDRITSFLGDVGDRTQRARREHDFVAIHKRVFINTAKDISSRDMVSDIEIEGGKVPLERSVKCICVDPAGYIDRLG